MRVLIGLLVLSLSPMALAAKSSEATPNSAEEWHDFLCVLDKNGDKKVSKQESLSFNPMSIRLLARNFNAIDANKDGTVTLEEYSDYLKQNQSKWQAIFDKADADKSGGLSKAELSMTKPGEFMQIKRHFDEMDSNKDGQVTVKERDAFFTMMREASPEEKAAMRKSRNQKMQTQEAGKNAVMPQKLEYPKSTDKPNDGK